MINRKEFELDKELISLTDRPNIHKSDLLYVLDQISLFFSNYHGFEMDCNDPEVAQIVENIEAISFQVDKE